MTDAALLRAIQLLLDGAEWTPDTLEAIGTLMAANGYQIRDPDDCPCNVCRGEGGR